MNEAIEKMKELQKHKYLKKKNIRSNCVIQLLNDLLLHTIQYTINLIELELLFQVVAALLATRNKNTKTITANNV